MTAEPSAGTQPERYREGVQVTLDFDSAAEPIRGSLRDAGGTSRAFTGWLGLLCTLEAALTKGAGSAAEGR
ncbi:MAG: hypothetical protein ACJ76S_06900 [Solirubrobacteraceae bacterium]